MVSVAASTGSATFTVTTTAAQNGYEYEAIFANSVGTATSTAATPLTVGLRQSIGAGDALTAGTYGKSLTFTLSAGTP